jgi:hypothetical protein
MVDCLVVLSAVNKLRLSLVTHDRDFGKKVDTYSLYVPWYVKVTASIGI